MKAPRGLNAIAALSLFITCTLGASNSTGQPTLLSDGTVDLGIAAAAYEKAQAFVATLTNAEKISIITGGDVSSDNGSSWSALISKDGAVGINMNFYVSGFSMPSALTSTYSPYLHNP